MPAQESLPGLVAQGFGKIGGPDDVGEHEGLPDAQRTGTPVLGVAELALSGFDIDPGPEPPELVERRAKLELSVVLVPAGSEGLRQHDPCPRHFIRGTDLAPAPDRA